MAAALLGAAVYDLKPNTGGSTSVSAGEAMRLMDSDNAPVLIDIRSATERESEQIPGNIHIPLDTHFQSNIEAIDSDNGYLLYCATGTRSRSAVRSLTKNDITQVRDIKGGIRSWASNGGQVAAATAGQKGTAA